MVKKKLSKKHLIKRGKDSNSSGSGIIYGLGVLGAVIYYIQTASSFWMGFLGIIKAFLWPAFLIYDLMKYLGM